MDSPESRALPGTSEPKDQPALPREYYARSSAFGYAHVLPDCAALFALLWTIGVAPLPFKVLAGLASSVVAYRMTFIVHDCSHGTLFARRVENEICGWVVASLLLVSFPVFRRLHLIHHLHYRRALDPQGTDYNGLVPGRDAVRRHLLAPLLFLNVIEKAGALLAREHCGMTAAERHAARLDEVGPPGDRARPAMAILAAQSAVALVATHGLAYWPGYFFYVLPLPALGLFLSRLRSYLEHGDLEASAGDRLVARTHESNAVEANLLASLFFNYHNEHHRWPQVPSRFLPAVYRRVTAGRVHPDDYSPSYASSLARLWRSCRQPRA